MAFLLLVMASLSSARRAWIPSAVPPSGSRSSGDIPRSSAPRSLISSSWKEISDSRRRTPSSWVRSPEATRSRTSVRDGSSAKPWSSQASVKEDRRPSVVMGTSAFGPLTEPLGTRFWARVGFFGSSGSMPSSRIRFSSMSLRALSKISSDVLPFGSRPTARTESRTLSGSSWRSWSPKVPFSWALIVSAARSTAFLAAFFATFLTGGVASILSATCRTLSAFARTSASALSASAGVGIVLR